MSTSILWTIKEFQSWPLSLDCYVIAGHMPFSKSGGENLYLLLWQKKAGELCIQVEFTDIKTELQTSIEVSLLDAELRPIIENCRNHTFSEEKPIFVLENFIKLDTLLDRDNKLLYNRDLLICCKIRSVDNSDHTPSWNNSVPAKNSLGNVLRSLLEREYYSDFVVQVKDKKFLCHKCVLSCRSEYFSAMFKSNGEENHRNKVVLEDIEPDIFQKLLHYIYTGELDVSEAETFELLSAADRFCLDRLKILCERKLHSSLCLENAMEMFTFASVYRLESLKMRSFLIARDFLGTSAWQYLSDHTTCMVDSNSEVTSDANYMKRPARKLETDFQFFIDELPPFRRKKRSKKETFLPMTDIWCRSELRSSEKDTWTIKEFRKRNPSTEPISSHTIMTDYASWNIKVYKEVETLNIGLNRDSMKENFLTSDFQYKFSILNTEMMEANIVRGSCRKAEDHMKVELGTVKSILSNKDLLHGEDLVLCCRFSCSDSECVSNQLPSLPESDLVEDISSLLNDQTTGDVVIKIESEQFPCHKAILSCFLPFICAKVQVTDRPAEAGDVVEIDDIKPTTFKKIISAMYTGKCEFTESEVWELFLLERKYHLFSTTSTFDDAFVSALSKENAVEAMKLTNALGENKLRNYVWQFIVQNLKEVMQTPNWSDIANSRALLSTIFVTSVSKTYVSS